MGNAQQQSSSQQLSADAARTLAVARQLKDCYRKIYLEAYSERQTDTTKCDAHMDVLAQMALKNDGYVLERTTLSGHDALRVSWASRNDVTHL